MSGAQIAHFLKQVGKGSELAGVRRFFVQAGLSELVKRYWQA